MEKFLKSLFQSDKGKGREGPPEEEKEPPPLDGRRKLSVSRSGRMKQANKKRLSLSMDIFGDDHVHQTQEKIKSREYHVHPMSAPVMDSNQKRTRTESKSSTETERVPKKKEAHEPPEVIHEVKAKTPEEVEIDIAFEIIEKA